jgi:predicted oxidoreductase (fatty acid repression mutant protein)
MFYQDEDMVEKFKEPQYLKQFGKYLGTYQDENKQVRVDLCLERTGVTAHLHFQNGLQEEDVTVNWWKAINEIARELGYPYVFAYNYGYKYYK